MNKISVPLAFEIAKLAAMGDAHSMSIGADVAYRAVIAAPTVELAIERFAVLAFIGALAGVVHAKHPNNRKVQDACQKCSSLYLGGEAHIRGKWGDILA